MDDIQSLKALIISKLSKLNLDLFDEFNAEPVTQVGSKPLVCIYLKGMQTGGGMMGDLLKTANSESGLMSTYGKHAIIQLGLCIYCSTAKCDSAFSDIASTLIFDSDVQIKAINCLSMEYSSNLRTYVLQGEMELERILATIEREDYIRTVKLNVSNDVESEVTE